MLRSPLPDDLGRTFTVQDALSAGVSRGRLRASDLSTPFRGARAPDGHGDRDAMRALVLLLGNEAAFSHTTAAALMGLPVPRRYAPFAPLHVTLPADRHRRRRPGIVCHRADRARTTIDGFSVVCPIETWWDLAPLLSVDELVCAADVLANRSTHAPRDLAMAGAARHGARGVRRARVALPLVRVGSGSPAESLTRLRFAEWGLPEPRLNVEVHGETGWLARVDFLWPARRVVAEYYGSVHGATWQADLARVALLEDAGYTVVVITADDLSRRAPDLRARLRRLLLC